MVEAGSEVEIAEADSGELGEAGDEPEKWADGIYKPETYLGILAALHYANSNI